MIFAQRKMESTHWILPLLLCTAVSYSVGLNCSVEDCEEKRPCPPDSEASPDGWGCSCLPSRCGPPPPCQAPSSLKLSHKGTSRPGDCCDVYECVYPQELNCSGVVCPSVEEPCPADSYRLPNSQAEGECCSRPMGCACLPRPCPPPACTQGLRPVLVRPGNDRPGTCCPLYQCHPTVSGNETCKLDGKEVSSGSKWEQTECIECYCHNGMVHCAQSVVCPEIHPDCPATRVPQGGCCPQCVFNHNEIVKPGGCKSTKGIIHKNGAQWQEDDCTTCTCFEGIPKCQAEMCHQTCKNATYIMGECCPKCSVDTNETVALDNCTNPVNCSLLCKNGYMKDQAGCTICKCRALDFNSTPSSDTNSEKECASDNGIKRDNGEAWYDKCRQCYCLDGKEMCSLISCARVDCPDPIFTKESCCPTCPGKEEEITKGTEVLCYGPGGVRHEMESWKQGCLECVCHNGSVLCHNEPCPPVLCHHPLQGDCCPVCPQEALDVLPTPSHEAQHSCGDKLPGEKWRQDECTSCICVNGEAICYTQTCDQVDISCKTPVQLKNQCCPICFDNLADEKICQVGNVTFNIGDEWDPEKCTRCSCGPAHTISCTQTLCERPCSRIDNSCCPKCTEVEDGSYWVREPIYMALVSLIMFMFGAASVLLWKRCQLKRHKLKICQPTTPSYPYKYVPTYDHSGMQTPHKSPV